MHKKERRYIVVLCTKEQIVGKNREFPIYLRRAHCVSDFYLHSR